MAKHINTAVSVLIPSANIDTHIGSVFNHVFKVMFQTEQTEIVNGRFIEWDFKDCRFLHPFYLAALSVLKTRYGETIRCTNLQSAIRSYFEIVFFDTPLVIDAINNKDSLWDKYEDKTYLPICVFNPKDKSSIRAQELIQEAVKRQIGHNNPVHRILSFLLGELIDNITDHSHSENGYLFCQRIPSENMLYVFICDTGHSIYASYAADDRYAKMLDMEESSALKLALSGKSTKNRPENENRGYGISKSREIIINGLGGEFFILSGGAFFRHDINGETLVDLPESIRWDGTVVLLKLPTIIPKGFNIYNHIG